MIAAVAWAKRGAPALEPTTTELPDEEQDDAAGCAVAPVPKALALWPHCHSCAGRHEEAGEDDVRANGKRGAPGKRRAMEPEDDDSDDSDDEPLPFVRQNLAFYKSNKDDPYLTVKEDDEELESEIEDFSLQANDLMLLGARSDEEMSNLEVYVYEPSQDNLYVHHDIPLPVFPLCLAWLEQPPASMKGPMGGGRNFVAVGTFQPFIEIWNLDVIDALEPAAVLGLAGAEAAAAAHDANAAAHEQAGSAAERGKKKKKKARPVIEPPPADGHTDAVMALAWNPLQPNVLASGSADTTVRLWDLGGDLNSSAQVPPALLLLLLLLLLLHAPPAYAPPAPPAPPPHRPSSAAAATTAAPGPRPSSSAPCRR